MKILVLTIFFVLMSLSVHAESDVDSPFAFTGGDLENLCIKNESVCALWIEGVVEGMEFMYVFGASQEPKRNVFCFENFDEDMAQIRSSFMEFISQEDSAVMREQPAVVSLSVGFQKYLCR
ncbi:MAG: hypothetical protein OEY94_06575 [Alphaproteobacteria bacterium]|nr:hypothetical protein [Alphaproteobacteria bacterium]